MNHHGDASSGTRRMGVSCRHGRSLDVGELNATGDPARYLSRAAPADFGFDQVAAIVPYLQALGVSHLYHIAVPQGTSWIEARL